MATLTYDFETDSTGSMPAGWSVLDAATDLCDTVLYLGDKVFLVSGDSGSAIVGCTDITGNLDDVIVETSFIRLGASNEPSVYIRTSGTDLDTFTGYRINSNNSTFKIQLLDRVTNPDLDSTAIVSTVGTWYKMKAEATGTTVRAKIWAAADAEPGSWTLSVSDSTYSTGSIILSSYRSNYFDDVSIESTDIGSTDVTQSAAGAIVIAGNNPTVNAKLSVSVGNLGAVAVAGYDTNVNDLTRVSAGAGVVSVSGLNPRLGIAPNTGAVVVEGYNPTINATQPQTASLWVKFKTTDGVIKKFNVGRRPTVQTVTGTAFAEVNDDVVLADATAGAMTVQLPLASGRAGFLYTVKKIDATASAVTVQRAGSDTIDGAASVDLTAQYDAIQVVSDGSDWWIVGVV